MAFDILPFAVADDANPLAVAIGADVVSQGARPAPKTGAMGCLVTLSGTVDGLFDLIVETTDEDTGAGLTWFTTNSRVNNVFGANTFRIPIVDPILDKVRLRIVRVGGSAAAAAAIRWVADRDGIVAL